MASSGSDSNASSTHSDPDTPRDTPPPLSNPAASHKLTNGQYNSFNDLFDDLQDHVAKVGFTVYKIRSCNYIAGFGAIRYDLGCYKGKIRASDAYSRETLTTKAGCT